MLAIDTNQIKTILETLLLVSDDPLSLEQLTNILGDGEAKFSDAELREILDSLALDYAERGFELKEVASGFRLQAKESMGVWVNKLWQIKPQRYSRALLETLALIAYRQPLTRAEIEEVRGVGVSSTIMKTLADREWVRIVAYKEVPGRPALYATTDKFLDYFNLKSLSELPPLADVKLLASDAQLSFDEKKLASSMEAQLAVAKLDADGDSAIEELAFADESA